MKLKTDIDIRERYEWQEGHGGHQSSYWKYYYQKSKRSNWWLFV